MTSVSRIGFALACCLAGLAGFVDGSGFVQFGGLFVSFMSGNSTRLGVEVARSHWFEAGRLAFLIAMFFAGAVLGATIGGGGVPGRRPLVLIAVAALLAVAAMIGHQALLVGGGALVLAMGAENAVLQRRGSAGIGLTYMTGALVKAGHEVAAVLAGKAESGSWLGNLMLWLSLCVGAGTGAWSYGQLGSQTFWIASAFALILAGLTRLADRRGLFV